MKQFVLDYLMQETARMEGAQAFVPAGHNADLHIQLKSGRQIAVYVINRALRLPEIRETFEENSMRKLHTLFIVDQRILPAHGEQAEAAYWMSALHALTHGRIYAYRCERREVTILPLHMEWKWGEEARQFDYGPPVSVSGLRTGVHDCNSKYIVGLFAVADFGDTPFWQKRPPVDKNYKYSWRNTSFRNEKKRGTQEEEQRNYWDAWDEFQRQYGEAPGEDFEFEFDFDWSGTNQKSSGSTGTGTGKRRYSALNAEHYALLGVSVGASLDEVKSAYRRKAREYHPDLHPQQRQEYTAKMAEINAAFEAIRKQLSRD